MPVKIGVIGTGHWASFAHLPTLSKDPDAVVAGIADPDDRNRTRAAASFGVAGVYADYRDLLAAEELDAAIIAVPHAVHFEVALAAIKRGLHVLIEKPLALEPAQGRELIRGAERAGVEIIVGYPWHYNAQSLQARQWVSQGRIGTLRYVDSFFGSTVLELYEGRPERYADLYGEGADAHAPLSGTYSDPAVAGGGQGQTQVTHSAALLLFMTGLSPESVFAFMDNLGLAVDVVDVISVRFEGGCLGLVGSTGAVVPRRADDVLEYRLYGSEGHIHFDVADGILTLHGRGGSEERAPRLPRESRYPHWAPARNLVDVVLGREQNGSPPLIGLRTVAFLKAAYQSVTGGGPVDVEGDLG